MSIQPGGPAYNAPVIPGQVITPAAVLDPVSMPAHAFCNVIRDLISKVPAVYASETAKHAAMDAVDAFEKRLVPLQDRIYVVSEADPAGREDVTKRIAPQTGYAPVPVGPQIDYAQLAQAILAAQRAAMEEMQPAPSPDPSPAPVQPVRPPFAR